MSASSDKFVCFLNCLCSLCSRAPHQWACIIREHAICNAMACYSRCTICILTYKFSLGPHESGPLDTALPCFLVRCPQDHVRSYRQSFHLCRLRYQKGKILRCPRSSRTVTELRVSQTLNAYLECRSNSSETTCSSAARWCLSRSGLTAAQSDRATGLYDWL